MVGEMTKQPRSPLLPDRHSQGDFFVCDIFDAAPKADMASMAHPVFSLSTKPDTRIRRYENGDEFIEVIPSVLGLATVMDRDVLIYAISQVMAGLNQGRKIERKLRLKAYDLLAATNRPKGGSGYVCLKAALERLKGTQIQTNITTGDKEILDGFGLIDGYRIVRETREGRMQEVEITLPDWIFNAIEGQEVLTLNRQYFFLRKPLERRLYELARKHCGQQKEWKIGLDKLRERMGSTSTPKEFKRLVKAICATDEEHGHMPDYDFGLIADVLHVSPKQAFSDVYDPPEPLSLMGKRPLLAGTTIDKAREIARGWCPYAIEDDWLAWMADGGMEPPEKPDAAFLGFVKKWVERRGPAK